MTKAFSAATDFMSTRERAFLLLQASVIVALYYASGFGAFALSATMQF